MLLVFRSNPAWGAGDEDHRCDPGPKRWRAGPIQLQSSPYYEKFCIPGANASLESNSNHLTQLFMRSYCDSSNRK